MWIANLPIIMVILAWMRKYTARIRCCFDNNKWMEQKSSSKEEKIRIQRLYLYIMEIHNVCSVRVFVQLKWICKGIKCHKIRIKGDNAICSSYRLVNWERTHAYSLYIRQAHEHWTYAHGLPVCLFNRSFVSSVVPSLTHSFIRKNKQIFQSYGMLSTFSNTLYGGFVRKMFKV